MRYQAIATDYDGTLAQDGLVDEATWAAIATYRQQGGKVILVTGREFDDLQQVCPPLDRFDAVIAENGGVAYWPEADQVTTQGEPPPAQFIERLRQAGIDQIHKGRVIVATWQPHGETVKQAIADLQIDYHVILNKRAVMILPQGVDKASTLQHVLNELQIVPSQVVGVGDAENDMALLQVCGLGVAVNNALPALKAAADYVTDRDRGHGVQTLIHQLLQGHFE
jgi:hypothetical protein